VRGLPLDWRWYAVHRWGAGACLWACACGAPDPKPAIPDSGSLDFDYTDHELRRFETHLVDGYLCPDAEDPSAASDVQFIECAIEGENERTATVADVLTVMSWNIERGQLLDAQLEVFRDGALPTPDVLLLSEADRGCPRSGDRNVTRVLAEALQMNWAYAVEFVELPVRDRAEPCEHGNAVLSRYPLANVSQLRHRANRSWRDASDEPRLGGRIAVAADVVVGARVLHVVSVHYESEISALDIQIAQAEETADHAAAQPFGVLVGGDTNAPYYTFDLVNDTTEDQTIGAFFERGFTDTHASLPADARATRGPLVLDVQLARDVSVEQPEVCPAAVCDPVSDHRAVWADLQLR